MLHVYVVSNFAIFILIISTIFYCCKLPSPCKYETSVQLRHAELTKHEVCEEMVPDEDGYYRQVCRNPPTYAWAYKSTSAASSATARDFINIMFELVSSDSILPPVEGESGLTRPVNARELQQGRYQALG